MTWVGSSMVGSAQPVNICLQIGSCLVRYDVELYRHAVTPQIKLWMDARPNRLPHEEAGNLALITSCPLVAVIKILQDMYGTSPELDKLLTRVEAFYV